MSTEDFDPAERERRLDRVLAACLEAIDQGQPFDAQEWLARYPEFAPELAELIEGQQHLGRLTGALGIPRRGRDDTPTRDETPVPAGATLRRPIPSAGPAARFGDYELVRELGSGGMGVVYEARQGSLQRTVALKMLRSDRPASAAERRRFRDEAESAAALDHPHLVPIYEVGELEGQAYFTMKLVEGGDLAGHLAEFTRDARAAARLLARVARAVHHAHQRGVLHRDLKPSNILLQKSETGNSKSENSSDFEFPISDLTPYVTDFGLAKRLQAASDLTQSGTIVGTPGYMAPEQAGGRKGAVTTAADVYGLGAVLYALLTGRAPFTGETPLETVTKVREQEPEPPSRRNPHVPRDLEAICLKCLEKEPHRRYGSAEALAKDLERWLRGEPIHARPIRWPARFSRWCRRNPGIAALTGVTLFLLLLLLAGAVWESIRVIEQRNEALAGQAALRERERVIRRQLYAADMRQAFESWRRGNLRDTHDLVARHGPEPDEEDLRGFEWYYLRHHEQAAQPRVLNGNQGEVYRAAFSPDGGTLAAAGADGTVVLWDSTTWKVRATLRGHTGSVRGLVFLPDGKTLATAGDDGTVRWWDPAAGAARAVFTMPRKGPEPGNLLALGADGRLLAWNDRQHACWCRVDTTEKPKTAWRYSAPIASLTVAPAGDRLMCGHLGGEVIIVDARTEAVVGSLGLPRGVTALAINHRGRYSAVGLLDGSLQLPVVTRGQSRDLLVQQHSGAVKCLAFSLDDALLASAGDDGIVRVWDLSRGTLRNSFPGHSERVNDVAFSPDGRAVVSAARDGTVRVWDLERGRERIPLEVALPPASHLAVSADGRTVVLAGRDQAIRIVDAVSGRVRAILRGHSSDVTAVALSPDGRTVATAGADSTIRLWDPATGQERRTINAGVDRALAFSPDSRVLAAGIGQEVVRWEVTTGRQMIANWKGHSATVRCLAYAPDGRRVVSGAADGWLRVWDAATGASVGSWKRQGATHSVALSPDGRLVVAACDGEAVLGDAEGKGTPRELKRGRIRTVAFSPDGQLVVAGNDDGYIHMWEAASGRDRYFMRWLAPPVEELAFADGGRTLALLQADGAVRLLDRSRWRLDKLFGQTLRPVTALGFSPDGQTLAVGGSDRQTDVIIYENANKGSDYHRLLAGNREDLRPWDIVTGRELVGLPGDEPWGAYSLAFAPHGSTLAVGDGAGLVWRWDLVSRRGLPPLYTSPKAGIDWLAWEYCKRFNLPSRTNWKEQVRCAFSPDGKLLAAATEHGPVHLWDTVTWQEQGILPVQGGPIHLSFSSSDGQTLAVSNGDTVELWDVAGRHRRDVLQGRRGRVDCLAYSPDGKLLAVGREGQVIQLWDLERRRLTPLVGHLDRVTALAFSPDGLTLASGSGDQTVRLWTVPTAQEIATLEGHAGTVTAVAFSPQGTLLASGGETPQGTGEVYLWPAPRSEGGE